MEEPENPADIILSAFKERNISIKRDQIESVFFDEQSRTENAKWVLEHLSYDTLLSREELTLYSKLESSGALKNILHASDIDATRPFLDEDIRTAIESLNASTATVQQQTEILTSQCDSLNKQLRQREHRGSSQGRDIERLRKKHESGRQNVAAATSDLVHEFETNLKSETEKATAEGKRILSSLTTRLKEDDRILAGLERLASGIDSSGDDVSVVKRTAQLGVLLAEYVTEEIQYRLDRLYLESIHGGQNGHNKSTENTDEELAALKEELESLYPEIDVLTELSAQQQFSEPILRELQNHHGQLRDVSHRKLEYVLDMVSDMTSSIEGLTKCLQDRESFCKTLESLTTVYRSEVGDQFSDQPSRRETLMKRRSMQIPSLPPAKRDSLTESQALGSVLRRLGLSPDSVFQSEEEDGGATSLYEKKAHIRECLRTMSMGADSPLAGELIPSDQASRLLATALNADSRFETSLSDVGQEKRLSELESQLGLIQKGAGKLNLDVLYQRDKNQEMFMQRWAP